MRCKKLKSILSIAAASVIGSTAMLNASASMSMGLEMTPDDSMIESVFTFGDSSNDVVNINPNYDPTKVIDTSVYNSTDFDNTVVSDVCCTIGELGLSVGIDYYVDSYGTTWLSSVYWIVTDLLDTGAYNVVYVNNMLSTGDKTIAEIINLEEFIKAAFPEKDVLISTILDYVYNTPQQSISIKGIMLTDDFVTNAQTYDYLFIDKNVSLIASPIKNNYLSSQLFEGGIYVRSTNRYISSINRDFIVDSKNNTIIYHNYPHSYENENVADGVLTVPYANNLDKVANWAFANTDWSGIDEIVFSNGIKEIGNIFANNNNIPTTLTFEDPEVTVGIENMVEYVKTIKGYRGSGAETFANEYDIPFIALDGDEPVTTTTTEPVVTTTTSTSVSTTTEETTTEKTTTSVSTTEAETTTTTTHMAHNRPVGDCTCVIDDTTELCPICGIPLDCKCGLDVDDPATTTTVSTSDEETTSTTITDSADSTTTSESTAENQIGAGTTTSTDTAVSNLRGDANHDGIVNVRDAAFIARALARKEADTLPEMADFNVDGKVDVRDAAAIARHLASKPKPEASSTSTSIEKPVETTTTTVSQTEDSTNTEVTTTATEIPDAEISSTESLTAKVEDSETTTTTIS